jgi:hypothetical protein
MAKITLLIRLFLIGATLSSLVVVLKTQTLVLSSIDLSISTTPDYSMVPKPRLGDGSKNQNNASETDDISMKKKRPIIAILVATRSEKGSLPLPETLFHKCLLASVFKTVTEQELEEWDVRLYVAIDDDDTFWLENFVKLQVPVWLGVTVGTFPKRKNHIPFNEIAEMAYDDGADYFCRVNDDTDFITNAWITAGTTALKKYDPPNLGVVGPTCDQGNKQILTHDMVHRTHLDIFGKDKYYPAELHNWYVDDWITHVYSTTALGKDFDRSTKLPTSQWEVKHWLSPRRYTPDTNDGKLLPNLYRTGHKLIHAYVKEHYPNRIAAAT